MGGLVLPLDQALDEIAKKLHLLDVDVTKFCTKSS